MSPDRPPGLDVGMLFLAAAILIIVLNLLFNNSTGGTP